MLQKTKIITMTDEDMNGINHNSFVVCWKLGKSLKTKEIDLIR